VLKVVYNFVTISEPITNIKKNTNTSVLMYEEFLISLF